MNIFFYTKNLASSSVMALAQKRKFAEQSVKNADQDEEQTEYFCDTGAAYQITSLKDIIPLVDAISLSKTLDTPAEYLDADYQAAEDYGMTKEEFKQKRIKEDKGLDINYKFSYDISSESHNCENLYQQHKVKRILLKILIMTGLVFFSLILFPVTIFLAIKYRNGMTIQARKIRDIEINKIEKYEIKEKHSLTESLF